MNLPHPSQPRKTPASFRGRLNAYSTAGKAVLAVGASAAAHGQVINITAGSFTDTFGSPITPPSVTMPGGHGIGRTASTGSGSGATFRLHLPMLPPGGTEMRLFVSQFNSGGATYRYAMGKAGIIALHTQTGILFNMARVGTGNALNLGHNAPVQGHSFVLGSRPVIRTYGVGPTYSDFPVGQQVGAGGFVFSQTGYIGFQVQKTAGARSYFGWLRIKVTPDADGRPGSISFVDKNGDGIYGAFNPTSGGPITTPLAAIPEPASVGAGLALFALGAAGVREHRRRRQAAA